MPLPPSLRIIGLSALVLALAGCTGSEPPDAAGPTTPGATVGADGPAPSRSPSARTTDPVAPGGEQAAGDPDAARFDGYGPARFGMTADEVRDVWDGELNGDPAEGATCFHLNPVDQPDIAYFALMFGDGEFVRYSVSNDTMTAPGGGRRGMAEAGIEELYGDGIERGNHKYVEDGEYLRIVDPAGSDGVLIFETDADDQVTEWRVGVPPYVDYVEGCA